MNALNLLAVFLGSGLGGVCRYLLSKIIQTHCAAGLFPWGTFVVNVAGCFLIGLFYGISDNSGISGMLSPQLRLMLTVGFCGGFTTFSTFVNENYLLFQSSNFLLVCGYVAASIIVGFLLLYTGYAAVQLFIAR